MKPEDLARYQRELLRALDLLDAEREAAQQSAKEFKGTIAKLEGQVRAWRNLLAGKAGEQLPMAIEEAARRQSCDCGVNKGGLPLRHEEDHAPTCAVRKGRT
jgi:hypothetical protein